MKTRKTFRRTRIAIAIAMALSPVAMNVYADDVEVIPDSGDNFRVRNASDTDDALRVNEGGEVFAPNLDTGSSGNFLCRDTGSGEIADCAATQGPTGPTGATGPQGLLGPPGVTGATGPQGPQGPQGKLGQQGPQGKLGQQGPQGKLGQQGPQGKLGQQGPQGKLGQQGQQGKIGQQGQQGKLGPSGSQGSTGATGGLGPQGNQGKLGPQGPQGPTGAAAGIIGGDTGSSDTLESAVDIYVGMFRSRAASNEVAVRQAMPTEGAVRNFYVNVELDPSGAGAGEFLFTMRVDGVSDPTLQCSIGPGPGEFDCSDVSGSVCFQAGEDISILSEPSGSPNVSQMWWSAEFTPEDCGGPSGGP